MLCYACAVVSVCMHMHSVGPVRKNHCGSGAVDVFLHVRRMWGVDIYMKKVSWYLGTVFKTNMYLY